MLLIEAKNPKTIELIKDHLIADPGYPQENMIRDYVEFMLAAPDRFVALVVLDGDQPGAFVLGYAVEQQKHFFVSQAWIREDVSETEFPKQMFELLKTRAEELGCDSLRMETKRSPMAWARKWGFELFSTIMSYNLDKEE